VGQKESMSSSKPEPDLWALILEFIAAGLDESDLSTDKVIQSILSGRLIRWRSPKEREFWDYGSTSNRSGTPRSEVIDSALSRRPGTAIAPGLRLLTSLGVARVGGRAGVELRRIISHPGYRAFAHASRELRGLASFALDFSILPGFRTTPALTWPLTIVADDQTLETLSTSKVFERGLAQKVAQDLLRSGEMQTPYIAADIVQLPELGSANSNLVLRFMEKGDNAVPLSKALELREVQSLGSAVLLPLPSADPAGRFTSFVYELSHNAPVDVAAWEASRSDAADKASPPIVVASRNFLDRARVSDTIRPLKERLRRLQNDLVLPVAPGDFRRFGHAFTQGLNVEKASTSEVAALLEDPGILVWDRESNAGEGLLAIQRGVEELERSTAQRTIGPSGTSQKSASISVPPSTATPAAIEPVIVRRTPHMATSGTAPFRPGDHFSVAVYVDVDEPKPGEESKPLVVAVPPGQTAFEVDVWIAATDQFDILGTQEKILVIPVKVEKSASVTFDLAVKGDVANLANARLTAYFTYQGRPSGEVSISVPLAPVIPLEEPTPPPTLTTEPDPTIHAVATFALAAEAISPDLTIEITNPRQDLSNLECRVSTPHLILTAKQRRSKWKLGQSTGDFVVALFKEFVDPGADRTARFLSLRGTGALLWDRVPEIVQNVVWRLIDDGNLRTILIVSADPFFPWELVSPQRHGRDGEFKQRPALGLEYSVGRWLPGNHTSPPQRVPLTSSLVVAPIYPGPEPKPLGHASAEAQLVQQHVPGTSLKPVALATLSKQLETPAVDLLHFVCHGAACKVLGIQSLYLETGQFTSLQFKGIVRSTKPTYPFVFLNACEVGRLIPTLAGVGGFASEFIDRGAMGVVAPLWSVKDCDAHKVAIDFYGHIKTIPPLSFAEIIRQIRSRAYSGATAGEDTYAAYCFYGDPSAIAQ
jgi:hypothetical protein